MIDNIREKIKNARIHLYDVKDKNVNHHLEGVLHQVPHPISENWQEEKQEDISNNMNYKKPKTSIYKKFFIFAIIFFILSIGFAVYMHFSDNTSVSANKIDLVVLGNAFAKGGANLPLEVEIVNRNNASLELVNLIVEYPSGASDDITSMTRLPRDTIGTIGAGERITRNTQVKLYGEEKSIRNVKVSLEYHPEGSNAIFTKEIIYPVTISEAPLSMKMDAPDDIVSDQEMTLNIQSILNTELPNSNMVLQMSYPNNFVFEDSNIKPDFGNSIWNLNNISKDMPFNLTIKGKVVGLDGDEMVFHAYAGIGDPSDKSAVKVVYNSLLHKMTISKPFLEAKIISPDYVSGGDKVDVKINWANNLSNRVTDTIITAQVTGSGLVDKSIIPNGGFYDSLNNNIVWDRNTNPELSSIEPGQSGTLSFSIDTKSFIGLYDNISDPEININVDIKGREPNLGSSYKEVDNYSNKKIKINSNFQIATSASYLSGSQQPKAETETKYNITWSLFNTVNNVSEAKAVAVLPVYVKWVSALGGEDVTYNEFTREVTWRIGQVRSNTGFKTSREASFTVSLTPSYNQIGSVLELVKEISLTGKDTFTGSNLNSSQKSVTTKLSNSIGDGRVMQ